jgi:hypothetical protein
LSATTLNAHHFAVGLAAAEKQRRHPISANGTTNPPRQETQKPGFWYRAYYLLRAIASLWCP